MKRVYIYCEGQTEESFINNVIYDYLVNDAIFVSPIVHCTKRTSLLKYRGGIINYDKFEWELKSLCKQHQNEYVTTMIDFYGLPAKFPGIDLAERNVYKKISYMEKLLEEKIGVRNFRAYISLHEFETLLFSQPEELDKLANNKSNPFSTVKKLFTNPELINNSVETAPSKRIYDYIPNYSKVNDGIMLSKEIGINKMMSECRHFREWIEKIKSI